MEPRQKEETWIKANHAYHKTLIDYNNEVEGLEREK
jgi:hypothetical protein